VLTAKRLRELLNYDPETGEFTRRVSRQRYRAGEVAGRLHHQGYVVIRVDQVQYSAHRLAWLWMTGEWPGSIDHRDRNRANNRWSNLRQATHQQNMHNMVKRNRYAPGVSRFGDRWQARITIGGARTHLGMFSTAEGAAAAYRAAALRHYGEYAAFEAA
jgi:hypothetical protein